MGEFGVCADNPGPGAEEAAFDIQVILFYVRVYNYVVICWHTLVYTIFAGFSYLNFASNIPCDSITKKMAQPYGRYMVQWVCSKYDASPLPSSWCGIA